MLHGICRYAMLFLLMYANCGPLASCFFFFFFFLLFVFLLFFFFFFFFYNKRHPRIRLIILICINVFNLCKPVTYILTTTFFISLLSYRVIEHTTLKRSPLVKSHDRKVKTVFCLGASCSNIYDHLLSKISDYFWFVIRFFWIYEFGLWPRYHDRNYFLPLGWCLCLVDGRPVPEGTVNLVLLTWLHVYTQMWLGRRPL